MGEVPRPPGTSLKRFWVYPPLPPILDEVAPGTPAEHAGLKEGDRIRSVDGQKIDYWGQFVEHVRGSKGQMVKLDLERKGQAVHADVTPQAGGAGSGDTIYQVGVAGLWPASHPRLCFSRGAPHAVRMA